MAGSGAVGTQRDLQVRLGATLTPLVVTLQLGSGEPLDPAGTQLVAQLLAREADTVPLAAPAFTVTPLEPSAEGAVYLIELAKEQVAELVALPAVAAGGRGGSRVFWWVCMFEDATGARVPVFFGKLTILLGASRG
jgi:hypothetical protein